MESIPDLVFVRLHHGIFLAPRGLNLRLGRGDLAIALGIDIALPMPSCLVDWRISILKARSSRCVLHKSESEMIGAG